MGIAAWAWRGEGRWGSLPGPSDEQPLQSSTGGTEIHPAWWGNGCLARDASSYFLSVIWMLLREKGGSCLASPFERWAIAPAEPLRALPCLHR